MGQQVTIYVLSPSFAADFPVQAEKTDDLGDVRTFGELTAAMRTLVKAIEKNLQASRNIRVGLYDRGNSEFVVDEITSTGGRIALSNCRVLLSAWTCDYGYFQALHYPCRHVLATCLYCRLDWRTYVDDMGFDDILSLYAGPQVILDSDMM
ncbi:hypothetical protein AHAS_Ahas15G0238700 [Arachis hypogaea]